MATSTPTDAVVLPQDTGTGAPSSDDKVDAAAEALMSLYNGNEFHTLSITADPVNDLVDVGSGVVFIKDTSTATANDRGASGNPQVQSTTTSGYDTPVVGEEIVYAVIFPSNNNGLGAAIDTAEQSVYVSVDVTQQNVATIHTGDISAPSEPYIKIGRFDTTASGDAVRLNTEPSRPRHVSTWTNPQHGGEKWTVPRPNFVKPGTNPILSGSNVGWANQLNFPSFFHAGAFLDNPLGEYYNYYSSHAVDGMGLLYTDDLRTSWTDQGQIADGSAITGGTNTLGESDAIWIPDTANGPLYVYANDVNANISRWYNTASDGTTWNFDQVVYTAGNHAGYPRMRRFGEKFYFTQFLKESNANQTSGVELRVLEQSETGTGNWTRTKLNAGHKDIPSGQTGSNTYWSHYDFIPYYNGYLYVWSDKRGSANVRLRLGYSTDGVHINDWGVQVEPTQTWEDGVVKYPNLFVTEGGTLGILYAGGDGGSGNSTDLGIVIDESGVIT